MAGPTLFTWGPIHFEVYPLNVGEWHHETSAEWAPKEICGAATYLEWVGEQPEVIGLRGRIFPYTRIGGLSEMDAMEAARHAGACQLLSMGGNVMLGWFVIDRLTREHEYVGEHGYGQVIQFEAVFMRNPTPDGAAYFPQAYRLYGGRV
jgi:phage protein U